MARNLSNAAASLLPYSTIEAAASGNVDAINAVLKHYERYIAALATTVHTIYDQLALKHKHVLGYKIIHLLLKFSMIAHIQKSCLYRNCISYPHL